jgi:hypothetical protein
LETALTLDDTGMVRLEGIANTNNSSNVSVLTAYTKVLKGNGTLNDFIESHVTLNESDVNDYQKINNNNWFFTIINETLTISNFDSSINSSFPFKDVLFNETGVYNLTINSSINFPGSYNNSLIHYPYVFQVD